MTEAVQNAETLSSDVEIFLNEARARCAPYYISPDHQAGLARSGRSVTVSLGYFERLFAPDDSENVTSADRVVDVCVSAIALGLHEDAETAEELLRSHYTAQSVARRMAAETEQCMDTEYQSMRTWFVRTKRYKELRIANKRFEAEAQEYEKRARVDAVLQEAAATTLGRSVVGSVVKGEI